VAGTTGDEQTVVVPRRRLLLVAAAALVVVLVGVVALAQRDDGRAHVVSPGPDRTTSTTTPITSTPITSTLDWATLPAEGIALQPGTGPVRIYDLSGGLLGTISGPRGGVDLRPEAALSRDSGLEVAPHKRVDVPAGCARARAARTLRVALCGQGTSGPSRIEVIESTGRSRTLVDGYPTSTTAAGYWEWAIPSPDGTMVLAQWSGECEAPEAFLVATATGTTRPVVGDGGPGGALTEGLGWAPDGRAIVHVLSGGCGPDVPEPGTYLVNPADLTTQQVLPEAGDRAVPYVWSRCEGRC